VLGGGAWLTSVTLAVIGRTSKNVGATARRDVGDVGDTFVGKCEEAVIASAT